MFVVSTAALTKHCDHMHSNPALYFSGPKFTLAPGVPAVLRFFLTSIACKFWDSITNYTVCVFVLPLPILPFTSHLFDYIVWISNVISKDVRQYLIQPRYFYPQRHFSIHSFSLRCWNIIATWCRNPKHNHYLNKNHYDSMLHLPKNSKQNQMKAH